MEKLEKNVIKLSWPIFIEMVFFTLMGTLDTLMLSSYSDTAVASVGVSNQILFFFGVIINVIAVGVGVVAAQYLGAKKIKETKDILMTGVVSSIILGLFLTALVLLFGDQLLVLINTDEALMNNSQVYLRIAGLTLVFVAIRASLSIGFRAFSKPKIVMVIMIIGNILNIVLNALLIYGLLGLPELGVTGAAIGTLISRVMMVVLLVIMSYKTLKLKLHKIRLSMFYLQKILYVGFPAAMENLTWNLAQLFIIAIVNKVGVEAVIARTYIYTLLSYIFIFSFSLASGNSIIVGYYIGEDQPEEAYQNTVKTYKINVLIVTVIALLLNIFSRQVIGIFTNDVEIIEMARRVLYFALFIEIGRAMNLVFIFALRSAGDTIFPVIMAMISMFGVAVAFSYIFAISLSMGIVGIFLASMLDENIRGISMVIRWRRGKWKDIKLVQQE